MGKVGKVLLGAAMITAALVFPQMGPLAAQFLTARGTGRFTIFDKATGRVRRYYHGQDPEQHCGPDEDFAPKATLERCQGVSRITIGGFPP